MLFFALLYVWFLTQIPLSSTQCPDVVPPCICATTNLEPVHIICDKADSLSSVLSAISSANNSIKIDLLTINNTQISELPPYAFSGFIIAKIQLKKMKLFHVSEDAFAGILQETLTDLDFSDNELSEIPSATSRLKNLKRLTLARNKVNKLSSTLMTTWKCRESLVSLDLTGNLLTNDDLSSISTFPALNDLNLAGNRLTQVPSDLLKNYRTTLSNLNLALNGLTHIPPFAFNQLENLQSLSLEYNNILKISTNAFQGLSNMLYLYLTGNKLEIWDPDIFRPIQNLRNLGIGSSSIVEIPSDAFKYIPKLIRLEMSNGGVERIGINAFKNTPRLHAVLLNNNRILQIKQSTFQGLSELYTLDLSNNRIASVEDYSFANLSSLKHLDVSNNELTTLDPHTFHGTFLPGQDSKTLYLCKNAWLCEDNFSWFRHWLRDNLEIIIEKPNCPSVCTKPAWLNNWPIRFPNPPPPNNTNINSSFTTTPTVAQAPRTPLKRTAPDDTPSKQPRIVTNIAHFLFGQFPVRVRQVLRLNNQHFDTSYRPKNEILQQFCTTFSEIVYGSGCEN